MSTEQLLFTRIFHRLLMVMVGGFIALTFTASAYAHSVLLWCYVENDRVYVEAFYSGSQVIKDGKITVVNSSGKKVFEGVTNKQGLVDFVPPVKEDMTVLLEVAAGHTSEFKLNKQDFLDAEKESQQNSKK